MNKNNSLKKQTLKKENIIQSLISQDHIKSLLSKNANQVYRPWNNQYSPQNPHSPFGDFPKEYMKSIKPTQQSIFQKNSQNVLDTKQTSSSLKSQKPPKAGACLPRKIQPSEFRKYYDRGDLPFKIDHLSGGTKIQWKINPLQLDYHHYLPIFMDGIREKIDPYRSLSIQGAIDLIQSCPDKVFPVIPQLIMPIKNSLNTRDPEVICITLRILQLMVQAGDKIGEALVPYYRQLLPILNIFKNRNVNSGDQMEYSQRKGNNLGELIQETLEILEQYGGDDAYINIKYMIPTYESCIVHS